MTRWLTLVVVCFVVHTSTAQTLSVKTDQIFPGPMDQDVFVDFPVINWISPSLDFARVSADDNMEISFYLTSNVTITNLTLRIVELQEQVELTPPTTVGTSIFRKIIPLQQGLNTVEILIETQSGAKVISKRTIRLGEALSASTDPFADLNGKLDGKLQIKSITRSGSEIRITYEILDVTIPNPLSVRLYSSLNNFRSPLRSVKGDTRTPMRAGSTGVIVWHAGREPDVTVPESISFGLRVEIFKPFAWFNQKFTKLRRGDSEAVSWSFGNEPVPVTFSLMNGSQAIDSKQLNGEATFLEIGKKVPPGNYRMRLAMTDDPGVFIESNEFRVSARVPVVWVVLPAAVVGGVVFKLLNTDSEPRRKRLPDPITPD